MIYRIWGLKIKLRNDKKKKFAHMHKYIRTFCFEVQLQLQWVEEIPRQKNDVRLSVDRLRIILYITAPLRRPTQRALTVFHPSKGQSWFKMQKQSYNPPMAYPNRLLLGQAGLYWAWWVRPKRFIFNFLVNAKTVKI